MEPQKKLPMEVAEEVAQDTGFVDPLGANSSATGAGFTGLTGSKAAGTSSRAAQRLLKGPALDDHAQAVAAGWDLGF